MEYVLTISGRVEGEDYQDWYKWTDAPGPYDLPEIEFFVWLAVREGLTLYLQKNPHDVFEKFLYKRKFVAGAANRQVLEDETFREIDELMVKRHRDDYFRKNGSMRSDKRGTE